MANVCAQCGGSGLVRRPSHDSTVKFYTDECPDCCGAGLIPVEPEPRKIVQITGMYPHFACVCDGVAWWTQQNARLELYWSKLPPIPQEDSDES